MGMIQCTKVFGGIGDALYDMTLYVASTCYSVRIMSTLWATCMHGSTSSTGREVNIYLVLVI